MRVEQTILKNILRNPDYSKKVLPFIKEEYFSEHTEQILFREISKFAIKYNTVPTSDALLVEVNQLTSTSITDEEEKDIQTIVSLIQKDPIDTNIDWLVDKTEAFCQERAIYNAIIDSLSIWNGDTKQEKGAIPDLLSSALAISFDPHIGHDYFGDFMERYDLYHNREEKYPFDLEMLNKATNGGVERKSLNVIMGGTGVGKTMFLCHLAAAYLKQGFNVLYITLEMAEHKIAKRIDANMFNLEMDDITNLSRDMYEKRISKLRSKTDGDLIIHEYPTAAASSLHFKALLSELQIKKSFKPVIVIVDYINICASARYKMVNDSYGFVKAIAEELRGLAVEQNLVIWTATQLNRAGFTSSDPGMENTSESFGLPATVDFMGLLLATETMKSLSQMMFKQLKSRYGDLDKLPRFVLGVDKAKMKFYDVESSAQTLAIPTQQNKTSNNVPATTQDMVDKFKKLKVT